MGLHEYFFFDSSADALQTVVCHVPRDKISTFAVNLRHDIYYVYLKRFDAKKGRKICQFDREFSTSGRIARSKLIRFVRLFAKVLSSQHLTTKGHKQYI